MSAIHAESSDYLTNRFLVAMPSMKDPFFSRAVIYICSHSEEKGSVGLMINKPSSEMTIGHLFDRFGIKLSSESKESQDLAAMPVLIGGPVEPEKSLCLHPAKVCAQMVEISYSETTLTDLSKGRGPEKFIMTAGYSHWDSGQLEAELMGDDWFLAPAHFRVLFETPLLYRWPEAAALAGVHLDRVSPLVGHG